MTPMQNGDMKVLNIVAVAAVSIEEPRAIRFAAGR
jgi:hypothetical protein